MRSPIEQAVHTLAWELAADGFQVVFGLLLGVLDSLLGVGIGLQLVDRLVQALRFVSVGNFAARGVRTSVHTCHVGAEAIEVHAEIVAGVKRSEAAIQCGERSAGISSGSVGG